MRRTRSFAPARRSPRSRSGRTTTSSATRTRVRWARSSRRRASTRSAVAIPTTSRARRRSRRSTWTRGSFPVRIRWTSVTSCAASSRRPGSKGPWSSSSIALDSRPGARSASSTRSSAATRRRFRHRPRSSATPSRACGRTRTPATSSASQRSATRPARQATRPRSRSGSKTSPMQRSSMPAWRWICATRSARRWCRSARIPTVPSRRPSTGPPGNAEAGWIQLVDRVKQEAGLIAEERRALAGSRWHIPGCELRESGIAGVGLGLNEVSEEAQLWDERLEHFGGLDASVRSAEPGETRRAHRQRNDQIVGVGLRIERYPGVGRQRNVPDAAAWSGAVPVKHGDRTVTVEERVVRRPVVVTDDLVDDWCDDAPSSIVRWGEGGKQVVVAPQQSGSFDEGDLVLVDPTRHRVGPPLVYLAGDELQDGAALLVHSERFGRRVEAHAAKVCEESVYRGCPWPGSAADGVANLDGGAHVAAERLFLHERIVSASWLEATALRTPGSLRRPGRRASPGSSRRGR